MSVCTLVVVKFEQDFQFSDSYNICKRNIGETDVEPLTPGLNLLAAAQAGTLSSFKGRVCLFYFPSCFIMLLSFISRVLNDTAGVVVATLTNPIWVLKTRMQLQNADVSNNYKGLVGSSLVFSTAFVGAQFAECYVLNIASETLLELLTTFRWLAYGMERGRNTWLV